MSSGPAHPALDALRQRLEEEEKAYAEVLAAVDRLADFTLPAETAPETAERLREMNALWPAAERPAGGGLSAAFRRRAFDAVQPALERQQRFNAALVQLLNAYLEPEARLHARLRELAESLVRYAQRVQPLVDARDRLASGLATTRAELILEAFDRRLESQGRRLEGMVALRDRLETLSEEVRALRRSLAAAGPPPAVATAAARAADDAVYAAFEDRLRGSRDEVRRKQASYVDLFRERAPVVDLGCGRGELLEMLREAGISARGVSGNAAAAAECRERGLDVVQGDPVEFLRAQPAGALGGVFAAQVAEHLPPPVLLATLAESHRALRPGGILVLEAVNPRSVVGFLEVFNRDLTHGRPLHPDTLSFFAAAAGFTDTRVEMLSPVPEVARLQPVPEEGLPEGAASALNENLERLNGLLYGPLEYALVAQR